MAEVVQRLYREVKTLLLVSDSGEEVSAQRVSALAGEVLAQWRHSDPALLPKNPNDAVKQVVNRFCGLGALQPYMDDPRIEEIWIDEPTRVFVARGGVPELTTTMLTEVEVHELVERMMRASSRHLDLANPFVDVTLAGGERLHVVIPPITAQHWAVNIRKHVAAAQNLSELVGREMLSQQAAAFLAQAVRQGRNILTSGATQAGKTTMLRALAGEIPQTQRIVTCEEVFELRLQNRDVVAMQTRPASIEGSGEIPLRTLVKETLRMRPDRIIIGEVRAEESLDMLIAANAGVSCMSTIHANSARDALGKLCTLPLLAGLNVTSDFVVPSVARSIDLVVNLVKAPDGRREVNSITQVTGNYADGQIETIELFRTVSGQLRSVQTPRWRDTMAGTGTEKSEGGSLW